MEGIDGTPAGGIRVGFPAADDLSPQAWVGESAAPVLPILVERLREGIAPLLIFLTGSATHGELCGLDEPGGRRRFLSDLDVGILTEDRLPVATQIQLARVATEATADAPEARLGFYCVADLERQDPTLGLVEGVRCGIVLHGDPGGLRRFRVPPPEAIPAAEGRRLLANRTLEWLAAGGDGQDASVCAYAASKLVADIAAVALLARGAYRGGGYGARARAVAGLDLFDEGTLERIDAWTRWRLAPAWDLTPLGTPVGDAANASLLTSLVREMTLIGMRVCAGTDDIAAFVSGLDPGPRVRARSWKRWIGSRAGKILSLRPAHLMHGPRGMLWAASMASVLGRHREADAWLSRLEPEPDRGSDQRAGRIVALGRWMDREGIE